MFTNHDHTTGNTNPIDEKLKHLQLEAKEESEELVHKESRKIVSETDRLLLADFNFKELRF
jgi:hypothetical protein